MTVLEGLSWEARTRVAGHLSGGKVKRQSTDTETKHFFLIIQMQQSHI